MATGTVYDGRITKTVIIDTNLTDKDNYLVNWDASDANVVNLSVDATKPLHVLETSGDGSTDSITRVIALSGITQVKLGGTVAQGDYLTSDANAKAITTTTANDEVVGMALEGGVADDIISVFLTKFRY